MKTSAVLLVFLLGSEPAQVPFESVEACEQAMVKVLDELTPPISDTEKAILEDKSQALVPLLLKSGVKKRIRKRTPRAICFAV